MEGLGIGAHATDINHPFDPAVLVDGIEAVLTDAETIGCHLVERSTALRQELATYFAVLEQGLPWTKAH